MHLVLRVHLNVMNIWDRSPLFESMLDGSHEQLDFPFVIDGELFEHLFIC